MLYPPIYRYLFTFREIMKIEITIGQYIIGFDPYLRNKSFWMGRVEDGEGGEFQIEALAKVLDQFYKDNF